MAHLFEPNAKAAIAAPSEVEQAAADLAILHPDVDLKLCGRTLTLREYRFVDGLKARTIGKPLTDAIGAWMDAGNVEQHDVEDYVDMLAEHADVVRELMLMSIVGADAEFIDGLSDADGETLLVNWWVVCGRFFVRLALRKLAAQAMQKIAARAGSTFATGSQSPATAAPTTSSIDTRRVN